jgi:putative selenium metabolism protein SsnA
VSTLLKNCTVVVADPPLVELADLRIGEDRITQRGASLQPRRGEEVVDLRRKLVMPGMVCAHTHLYSSLSRGMPQPKESPRNFLEILQKVWWKLDRALDEETIYWSAIAGALEALSCGTTTLVDHHASPSAIPGSLDIIKEALGKAGVRGVLCYEVTDRGGMTERDQGVKENDRFIRKNRNDNFFRGAVGAHAAFTLSEASMSACGELAQDLATGVHIHVAEDLTDSFSAQEEYRCNVVDRLQRSGCLSQKSILAHCVHLSPAEMAAVREQESWVIHNPRSNMNNAVGHAPIHSFGERTALGTDGFPADMFEEMRCGFFGMRDAKEGDADFLRILHAGQQMISEYFGKRFGSLASGSVADLVVLDYASPTVMTAGNLPGHLLFGMHARMVESVMVGGKWVMKNREIAGLDLPAALDNARKAGKKLWQKMERV